MKTRRINGRRDEPNRRNNCQITFRTTLRLSGAWSSLRGLCQYAGHGETSSELFDKVVLPAMREYVAKRGYAEKARERRMELKAAAAGR